MNTIRDPFAFFRPNTVATVLDGLFDSLRETTRNPGTQVRTPPIDVVETDTTYSLRFEMPGLNEADIEVERSGNRLVVTAERHSERDNDSANAEGTPDVEVTAEGVRDAEGTTTTKPRTKTGTARWHHAEHTYGKLRRSVTLPEHVNLDQIDASYTAGILRIDVPKLKKEGPTKINVRTR